jgi:DNA segregation ATPase FtsK/SpoIIIE, S-DNA-T family
MTMSVLPTDQILADAAYEIIRHNFDSDGGQEKECFRVKNFTEAETLSLLDLWSERAAGDNLSHVRVVVASDAGEAFPEQYRADPETTITSYRNNPEPLLYVETKVESDEQGLKNLFTLRDVNFLDGTFDSDELDVARTLITSALRSAGAEHHAAQGLFVNRVLEVHAGLRDGGFAIPVRKFTTFSFHAAAELGDGPGSIEAAEMDRLIGKHLIHLDMFADETWRRDSNRYRFSRRLTQNMLHSELASSHANDLDQDKLVETCHRVRFRSLDGEELPEAENDVWQELCAKYCGKPQRKTRIQIPYCVFEQLFSRDVKGLKLGDRVQTEIDQADPARLPELEGLGVYDGLNRRDREAAQRFLEAETDGQDLVALRDLLTKQTRRMVEKVAYPTPERFSNPLLKLAQVASSMRSSIEGREGQFTIQLRLGRNADPTNASISLFAFLYGATLRSIAENSELSTTGFKLSVDERLWTVGPPPELLSDGDDDEDGEPSDPIEWEPVSVEFGLTSDDQSGDLEIEAALEWAPFELKRLSLFWLMVAANDRPVDKFLLTLPHGLTFDTWVDEVVSRMLPLRSVEHEQITSELLDNDLVSKLLEMRRDLFEVLCRDGVSSAILSDAFDCWDDIFRSAKELFIPDGKMDGRLNVFLHYDCISGSNGESVVMLGSHPLKFRWLARYLRTSEELAAKALEADLPLNSQNQSLYLDWVGSRSSQQQPAVHISRAGQHLLSTGEAGLTEEFHIPSSQTDTEYQETFPSQITEEIVSQIKAYLEAHPYKRDGLSILVVTPTAPRFSADLVSAVRKGEWSDLRAEVHLSIPKHLWEHATGYFEAVPSDNRMLGDRNVAPPLELKLYNYNDEGNPARFFEDLEVDLAVVPQFFQGKPDIQENTEPSQYEVGSFDPLLDRPTFVYGGTEGGAISVSQRPMNPDPALSAWSSAVVRQHRLKPVSAQQPENHDFLELRLDFQKASELFCNLHDRAHWVITLEQYITREQVEGLENRPEILTVRDRVGPGGIFTLIVSSNSGRKFIISRVERRLSQIVETSGGNSSRVSTALAAKIYDETRQIAPRLALKAMGISRVTEEILGLAMGRHILEKHLPPNVGKGFVAWISLDEHQGWFGGLSSTRADLCRVVFDYSGERLSVDLLVLETKLRRGSFDPHGITQVDNTMELFRDFMGGTEEEETNIDSRLWRELLLAAIETANTGAINYLGTSANTQADHENRIPMDIRNAFREGDFELRDMRGVYSICIYGDSEISESVDTDDGTGITIYRSSGEQLLSLVSFGSEKNRSRLSSAPPEEGNANQSVQPHDSTGNEDGSAVPSPNMEPSDLGVTDVGGSPPISRSKLSVDELERRYQAILNTYSEFDIPVRKPEKPSDQFVEGPASILFRLRPGQGVDVRKLSEKSENLRLMLRLEESQNVRFSIDRGNVTIDVPKSVDDRYFVNAEDLWSAWSRPDDALATPLGEDRLGNSVILNFSSNNSPHLLIGGTTGSGKSEALNTILEGLIRHYTPQELRLMLVDPKSTELQHLANAAHVEGDIGWDEEDACRMLEHAVNEMQRRYKILKGAGKRSLPDYNSSVEADARIPWWLVVLDEYADLTSDKDAKKAIEASLKRLAQKARAAGIHVVIATQKPSADVISTNLRSNLPSQLALKVKGATESRVIMDETGAETLNGLGDAFLKSEGRLTRVQCAKV